MKPVQLFSMDRKTKLFYLNLKGLRSIIERDEIKDRWLVACAVVGDFRKGKSFLLNYFIRYLEHTYPAADRVNVATDWMSVDEDKPLQGFDWGPGMAGITQGVWIWPKLFLTYFKKQPVAIMLIDSQGMMETLSSIREWSSLGAICTLMSSVLVYNVDRIDGDSVSNITAFIAYGELLTLPDKNYKTFQKCVFLRRDFNQKREYGFGLSGGEKYMNEALKNYNPQPPRRDFRTCFDTVVAWTMPYPGSFSFVTSPKFDGSLQAMLEEFKDNLRDLGHYLFHPEKLVIKAVNGKPIQVKELLTILPTYVDALNKDAPRKMEMARDVFFRVECDLLVDRALAYYEAKMIEAMGPDQPFREPHELLLLHDVAKAETKVWVKAQPRVASDEDFNPFLDKLDKKMSEKYKQFYQKNKAKEGMSLPYLIGGALVSGGMLFLIVARLGYSQTYFTVFMQMLFLTVMTCFYASYRGLRQ